MCARACCILPPSLSFSFSFVCVCLRCLRACVRACVRAFFLNVCVLLRRDACREKRWAPDVRTDSSSLPIARGSKKASPAITMPASFPREPEARSTSEIAYSSSSRDRAGAITSRSWFGVMKIGAGWPLAVGTRKGVGTSSGLL